jgi:hypothetical protein
MVIQLIIDLIILALLIYYITVILHVAGIINLYPNQKSRRKLDFGKALRPFYYWFK